MYDVYLQYKERIKCNVIQHFYQYLTNYCLQKCINQSISTFFLKINIKKLKKQIILQQLKAHSETEHPDRQTADIGQIEVSTQA